jgi:hypothetical protein
MMAFSGRSEDPVPELDWSSLTLDEELVLTLTLW